MKVMEVQIKMNAESVNGNVEGRVIGVLSDFFSVNRSKVGLDMTLRGDLAHEPWSMEAEKYMELAGILQAEFGIKDVELRSKPYGLLAGAFVTRHLITGESYDGDGNLNLAGLRRLEEMYPHVTFSGPFNKDTIYRDLGRVETVRSVVGYIQDIQGKLHKRS